MARGALHRRVAGFVAAAGALASLSSAGFLGLWFAMREAPQARLPTTGLLSRVRDHFASAVPFAAVELVAGAVAVTLAWAFHRGLRGSRAALVGFVWCSLFAMLGVVAWLMLQQRSLIADITRMLEVPTGVASLPSIVYLAWASIFAIGLAAVHAAVLNALATDAPRHE